MAKKEYIELLKDPRWQKKRLEIMQRDNFTCQHCGSTEKTLNVHHLLYSKGSKPWEYDNDNLITLCQDCHEKETEAKDNLYLSFCNFKDIMAKSGFSYEFCDKIIDSISYFDVNPYNKKMFNSIKYLISVCANETKNKSDLKALENWRIGIDEYLKNNKQ